ncbi:MAG: hypothetical protein KAH32_01595 [Chlamydiia bacterium]|nr:hypothetical protein [Chlamydiia bacterium]
MSLNTFNSAKNINNNFIKSDTLSKADKISAIFFVALAIYIFTISVLPKIESFISKIIGKPSQKKPLAKKALKYSLLAPSSANHTMRARSDRILSNTENILKENFDPSIADETSVNDIINRFITMSVTRPTDDLGSLENCISSVDQKNETPEQALNLLRLLFMSVIESSKTIDENGDREKYKDSSEWREKSTTTAVKEYRKFYQAYQCLMRFKENPHEGALKELLSMHKNFPDAMGEKNLKKTQLASLIFQHVKDIHKDIFYKISQNIDKDSVIYKSIDDVLQEQPKIISSLYDRTPVETHKCVLIDMYRSLELIKYIYNITDQNDNYIDPHEVFAYISRSYV